MASKTFIAQAQTDLKAAQDANDTERVRAIFEALQLAFCGESDRTCRHLSGYEPRKRRADRL